MQAELRRLVVKVRQCQRLKKRAERSSAIFSTPRQLKESEFGRRATETWRKQTQFGEPLTISGLDALNHPFVHSSCFLRNTF